MTKHLPRIIFCAVFLLIPALIILSAWDKGGVSVNFLSAKFPSQAETAVRQSIPFRENLLQLSRELYMAGGRRELISQPGKQNGIFVVNGELMKNIDPPVQSFVDENIAAVQKFAENMSQIRRQTYFMLIPTSGAILQQKLPNFAQSVMVNQRRIIEDAYSRVSGGTLTIDAYSALISRQNQYIYYRTESNLTSLGGFYVYSAMLSRLGLGQGDLNEFDIDYVDNNYYGDLYRESGYKNVLPDSVSLFRYSASNRDLHEFLVTHSGDEPKTYHTLFPAHAALLKDGLDVFFGGVSAITDITASSHHSSKILIFGDKTAISYLPFLVNNCKRVTLVDLSYGESALASIDPRDYDKIIFAYGVESFMHTNNLAKATNVLRD